MHLKRRALPLSLLTAALAFAALPPAVAQPAPLGPEIRVDTATGDGLANDPQIGLQRDGSFVIAWDTGESEPALIFARPFRADGTPRGAEALPLGVGAGEATLVQEVALVGRGFDVVWQEISDLRPQKSPFFHRHLDRRGVPDAAAATRLGSAETRWVWPIPGLGFLGGRVAARAHGLAVQRLGAKGRPTGPEIRINSRPVDDPEPLLFGLPGGGFVAVWAGVVPGPASPPLRVLRARRFDATGAPLGPDFDLNTLQPDPDEGQFLTAAFSAAAAPDGGFAVAWTLVDDDRSILFLRSFDRTGRPIGSETAAVEGEGSVNPVAGAIDDSGNVLLAFLHAASEPPSSELRLQLFDRAGEPLGPAQELNSEASDEFAEPFGASLAWTGDRWLVTWVAEVEGEERGAVFLRRFAGL